MKRMATASLLLTLVMLLPAASPARAGGPLPVRVDLVEWNNVPGAIIPCLRFHTRFSNPNPFQASQPVSGQMHTQPFGAFVPNGQLIGSFDVPPMEPMSFFDVFFDVELADLPPSAERITPGSGPGPSRPPTACPPDEFWAGNVDVFWTGPGGTGQVNVHNGTIQINPNSAPSYIHVIMDCNSSTGINWSFGSLCPGWSATLVLNSGFSPGGPAPNPIPQGFFDGWICVSANNTVVVGSTCSIVLNLTCGGEPATINVLAEACDSPATPVRPTTWSEMKLHFRN